MEAESAPSEAARFLVLRCSLTLRRWRANSGHEEQAAHDLAPGKPSKRDERIDESHCQTVCLLGKSYNRFVNRAVSLQIARV